MSSAFSPRALARTCTAQQPRLACRSISRMPTSPYLTELSDYLTAMAHGLLQGSSSNFMPARDMSVLTHHQVSPWVLYLALVGRHKGLHRHAACLAPNELGQLNKASVAGAGLGESAAAEGRQLGVV